MLRKFAATSPTRVLTNTADEVSSLSTGQRDALTHVTGSGLSVVTGLPGTGTTTLVRALVAVCGRDRVRLGLLAPTGRAARRLSELTGHPAHTVHRALEWSPQGGPTRTSFRPRDFDVIVCDEASMLALHTLRLLLDAVPRGARLVFVCR